MEHRLKWKLHELMNGGVVFLEIPNDGDTYTYTYEDNDYKFVFVEDHWELEEE